jgi:hypothetical protein
MIVSMLAGDIPFVVTDGHPIRLYILGGIQAACGTILPQLFYSNVFFVVIIFSP